MTGIEALNKDIEAIRYHDMYGKCSLDVLNREQHAML